MQLYQAVSIAYEMHILQPSHMHIHIHQRQKSGHFLKYLLIQQTFDIHLHTAHMVWYIHAYTVSIHGDISFVFNAQ